MHVRAQLALISLKVVYIVVGSTHTLTKDNPHRHATGQPDLDNSFLGLPSQEALGSVRVISQIK